MIQVRYSFFDRVFSHGEKHRADPCRFDISFFSETDINFLESCPNLTNKILIVLSKVKFVCLQYHIYPGLVRPTSARIS